MISMLAKRPVRVIGKLVSVLWKLERVLGLLLFVIAAETTKSKFMKKILVRKVNGVHQHALTLSRPTTRGIGGPRMEIGPCGATWQGTV